MIFPKRVCICTLDMPSTCVAFPVGSFNYRKLNLSTSVFDRDKPDSRVISVANDLTVK
jgi:hypothetical protein